MPQLLDETLDNILQHGSDIDILKAVGLAQSFILKVKYKKLSETDLEALLVEAQLSKDRKTLTEIAKYGPEKLSIAAREALAAPNTRRI